MHFECVFTSFRIETFSLSYPWMSAQCTDNVEICIHIIMIILRKNHPHLLFTL